MSVHILQRYRQTFTKNGQSFHCKRSKNCSHFLEFTTKFANFAITFEFCSHNCNFCLALFKVAVTFHKVTVHKDKHLGNCISDSIHGRHILNNVCDLSQRSNLIIRQFRSCDSETLDRLHKTYCMHMYGCDSG